MKALTLTQPWATLAAIGAKKIETRNWSTSYRGSLAIHAAKGYGKGGMKAHKALCGTEPFCSVLSAACERHYAPYSGLKELVEHPFMPTGAIVAVCELAAIWPTTVRNGEACYCTRVDRRGGHNEYVIVDDQERAFGDYTPGRYAWLLADIRALPEPIPAKGALGLWEYEGVL